MPLLPWVMDDGQNTVSRRDATTVREDLPRAVCEHAGLGLCESGRSIRILGESIRELASRLETASAVRQWACLVGVSGELTIALASLYKVQVQLRDIQAIVRERAQTLAYELGKKPDAR
jgi:hypothetical protein